MKQKVTINPSRVGCPSLPGTMKGIVMGIDGVEEVDVRYEDRSFDVVFDDSKTDPDTIVKVIGEELGLAMEAGVQQSEEEKG